MCVLKHIQLCNTSQQCITELQPNTDLDTVFKRDDKRQLHQRDEFTDLRARQPRSVIIHCHITMATSHIIIVHCHITMATSHIILHCHITTVTSHIIHCHITHHHPLSHHHGNITHHHPLSHHHGNITHHHPLSHHHGNINHHPPLSYHHDNITRHHPLSHHHDNITHHRPLSHHHGNITHHRSTVTLPRLHQTSPSTDSTTNAYLSHITSPPCRVSRLVPPHVSSSTCSRRESLWKALKELEALTQTTEIIHCPRSFFTHHQTP